MPVERRAAADRGPGPGASGPRAVLARASRGMAVAALAALLAGCGATLMPGRGRGSSLAGSKTGAGTAAPGTGTTGTAGTTGTTGVAGTTGTATGTAGTGTATPAAADPAARYAQYFRFNGTATIGVGQTLGMKATDFAFSPNTLTVKAGTVVRLRIDNASAEPHNFDLPSQRVNVNLPAGRTTTVSFTPARPGTYYFYCNLPGHAAAGMVGKITVQ